MLAVFIARRWLGLSLRSALSELGVSTVAGVLQAVCLPFTLAGGLLGHFTIGLFPVWAVFSLAHRDRWEAFDGLKFAGLQAIVGLIFGLSFALVSARHS